MTSMSKNVYIDKLVDMVNKYNNTHLSAIKIKSVDVKSSTHIDLNRENINKIVNLKLVTMQEYRNIKTCLQKVLFKIGIKKFL